MVIVGLDSVGLLRGLLWTCKFAGWFMAAMHCGW